MRDNPRTHGFGTLPWNAIALLAVAGCAAPAAQDGQDRRLPDDLEEVTYRGRRVLAQRFGDDLVIDGDILVSETDLRAKGPRSQHRHDKGTAAAGPSLWAAEDRLYKWTNGVIPYVFDDGIPEGPTSYGWYERDLVREAMARWTQRNPAIRFVPRSGQADYLLIRRSDGCNAYLGMTGGEQYLNMNADCFRHPNSDHELGHTLGLQHEHQRSDRDAHITILWGNMVGCPSNATTSENCTRDACTANPTDCGCTADAVATWMCQSQVGSYPALPLTTNIGPYDYGSIMHYNNGNAKCKNAAGSIVLGPCTAPGLTVQKTMLAPPGRVIAPGQTPSALDLASISAMYPTLRVQTSAFSRTGTQPLCILEGRTEDVGTYFSVSGVASTTGGMINTNATQPGEYTVTCGAKSLFWYRGDSYPNTTRTTSLAEINATPSDLVESFSTTTRVTLLEPGLIAALF